MSAHLTNKRRFLGSHFQRTRALTKNNRSINDLLHLNDRDKTVLLSDYVIGLMLGLLFSFFVLIDLILRPSFVAINIFSDTTTRATPPIVSALHFLTNFAFVLPCGYAAFSRDVNFIKVSTFLFFSAGLVIISVISLFAHVEINPIVLIGVLAFNFIASSLFSGSKYHEDEAMTGLFCSLAIVSAVVLVLAIGVGEYNWGRLASRAGPNFWGRVALACVCSCICVKNFPLRMLIIAISISIMYLTSSRGSMLAAIAAGFVVALFYMRKASPIKLGLFVMGGIIFLAASPFVIDKVFHLSDPRRGLDSGATGRSLAWTETWNAFISSPWVGIGFRRHEQYVTVASSAHSAYLATLAEVGIIGFLLYAVFVFGALLRSMLFAFRTGAKPVDIAAAAYMVSFVVLGIFETQALTTGSQNSLLMIFVAGYCWRSVNFPDRRLAGKSL